MDTHELAWAAGFFDGEGCFTLVRTPRPLRGGQNIHPRLSIGQIDRRALDRFREAVSRIGIIVGPESRPGRHDIWRYRVTSWTDVQAIGAFLWQWLGPVKRAQFTAVMRGSLDNWKALPRRVVRLTDDQAAQVRADTAAGIDRVRLAERYGVTPSAIGHIVNRRVHRSHQ